MQSVNSVKGMALPPCAESTHNAQFHAPAASIRS
jgi:hypothetical protein